MILFWLIVVLAAFILFGALPPNMPTWLRVMLFVGAAFTVVAIAFVVAVMSGMIEGPSYIRVR